MKVERIDVMVFNIRGSKLEVTEAIKAIITEVNATSAKDMGKVMGIATKQFAGRAEGKTISTIVKQLLG